MKELKEMAQLLRSQGVTKWFLQIFPSLPIAGSLPGSETTADEREDSGPETEGVCVHKSKPAVDKETADSDKPIQLEPVVSSEGKKNEAKENDAKEATAATCSGMSETEKERVDQQVEDLLKPYILPDSPPMPQWLINILAQKALQDAIDSFAKYKEKDKSAGSASGELPASLAFQDAHAHI